MTRGAAGRANSPRPDGEASFFYRDSALGHDAVKLLPGEHYVAGAGLVLTTVLGSCVSACIFDDGARIGGMNHFMLPHGTEASGRFGVHAMEILINELIKRGARRSSLKSKVFGGGAVVRVMESSRIGEQNVAFVEQYLSREGIPILARDTLDVHPRRVAFFPDTGKAMVKRLSQPPAATLEHEASYSRAVVGQAQQAGSIDLF